MNTVENIMRVVVLVKATIDSETEITPGAVGGTARGDGPL
jgi:hypothetical protein